MAGDLPPVGFGCGRRSTGITTRCGASPNANSATAPAGPSCMPATRAFRRPTAAPWSGQSSSNPAGSSPCRPLPSRTAPTPHTRPGRTSHPRSQLLIVRAGPRPRHLPSRRPRRRSAPVEQRPALTRLPTCRPPPAPAGSRSAPGWRSPGDWPPRWPRHCGGSTAPAPSRRRPMDLVGGVGPAQRRTRSRMNWPADPRGSPPPLSRPRPSETTFVTPAPAARTPPTRWPTMLLTTTLLTTTQITAVGPSIGAWPPSILITVDGAPPRPPRCWPLPPTNRPPQRHPGLRLPLRPSRRGQQRCPRIRGGCCCRSSSPWVVSGWPVPGRWPRCAGCCSTRSTPTPAADRSWSPGCPNAWASPPTNSKPSASRSSPTWPAPNWPHSLPSPHPPTPSWCSPKHPNTQHPAPPSTASTASPRPTTPTPGTSQVSTTAEMRPGCCAWWCWANSTTASPPTCAPMASSRRRVRPRRVRTSSGSGCR